MATYYADATSLSPATAVRSGAHFGTIDFSAQGGTQSQWPSLAAAASFAVKWSGFVRSPIAGVYTTSFSVRSASDRVRLWIDNALVLDQWASLQSLSPAATYQFPVEGGYYEIRAQYSEKYDAASSANSPHGATLSWETATLNSDGEPVSKTPMPSDRLYAPRILSSVFEESVIGGLQATAYLFVDMTVPRAWAHMPNIDFSREADSRSALPGIDARAFSVGLGDNNNDVVKSMSVRWSGFVRPQYAQTYTFAAVLKETDERVRVWVDDTLIVDQWASLSSLRPRGYATFACPAGSFDHAFHVQYSDRTGARGLKLLWSSEGEGVVKEQVIPSERLAVRAAVVSSPYTVTVRPDGMCASRSSARGAGVSLATAGSESTFALIFRDRFDNILDNSNAGDTSADIKDIVAVRQVSADSVSQTLRTRATVQRSTSSGSSFIYAVTRAGAHKLYISAAVSGGLYATYYSEAGLAPSTAVKTATMATSTSTLIDPAVTACLASTETFSVRWTGFLSPLSQGLGVYTMQASVADAKERVRMWLDHLLIIDQWTSIASLSPVATIRMAEDANYDIRIDYQRQATIQGRLELTWATPTSGGVYIPITARQLATESSFSGYPGGVFVLPNRVCGSRSRASGSGLTIATAGDVATFTITAYDAHLNHRTAGGDQFIVQAVVPIVDENAVLTGQSEYKRGVVTDKANGTYSVAYPTSSQAGSYNVWANLAIPGGLLATYYDDTEMADAKDVRMETGVQILTFGSNKPIQALSNANTYSVRWSGYVSHEYAETYTYSVKLAQATERVRLWVDNSLVLDQWASLSAASPTATAFIAPSSQARLLPLELTYQHQYGDALAELRWSSASQALASISSERLYQAYTLQGFPVRAFARSSTPCAAVSVATGTGLTLTQACMSASFTIRAKDYLQNQLSSDLAQVFVRVTSWEVNGQQNLVPFDGKFSELGTVTYMPVSKYAVSYASLGTANVLNRVSFVTGNGLAATYYNGQDLDPTQAVSAWPSANSASSDAFSVLSYTSPSATLFPPYGASLASAESFSVRWQGLIRPDNATNYSLYFGLGSRKENEAIRRVIVTRTDERVRLWLDNHLLIDQWTSLSSTLLSATVGFPSVRYYDVKIEYRNWKDIYAWSLKWAPCVAGGCAPGSAVVVPSGA
jgi:hypothetical protein